MSTEQYERTALGPGSGEAKGETESQPSREALNSTKPAPAPASPLDPRNVDHIKKLNKIIKGTKTCMFTTVSRHGIHARPMATAGLDFDSGKGEHVYFVTAKGSTKVAEIKENSTVALVFSNDANNTWATLSANAEVIEDAVKARELWMPTYSAYFPEGPSSSNIVIIKVTPHMGSYWAGNMFNRAHIIFSSIKARLTGRQIDQRLTQEANTVRFPSSGA